MYTIHHIGHIICTIYRIVRIMRTIYWIVLIMCTIYRNVRIMRTFYWIVIFMRTFYWIVFFMRTFKKRQEIEINKVNTMTTIVNDCVVKKYWKKNTKITYRPTRFLQNCKISDVK